ncbi:Sphingosine N-acyltransferase lag1 [Candida viswanathii]|uniref:Sphingosine N-acyltransferase lag1 n=1 Tax=Candida viswanathii TaxID=5486 RepID=A0A367XVM2_9ASCO|nr:Sphingosine N-acyltransferase lag1 [Candida viswanathii]
MTSKTTSNGVLNTKPHTITSLEDQKYHDSFLALIERNQIPLSRNLLVLLYSLHFLTSNASPIHKYTSKFITLQNVIGFNDMAQPIYDIDLSDAFNVLHWIIVITFLRSFLMKYCFEPFASRYCNIHSKKAKTRFAEQSWSFTYYSASFIYGVVLYWNSPYFNNLDQVYISWPNHYMSFAFKNYYLTSMGFWLQQIFVLNVEKPRKDHYQMFSHHIITCLLIVGSYYYYFYRIGHLILMLMDSVDIFLSAAKMLKYAGFPTACDAMFVVFLISWIVLRHGLYNYIYLHAWKESTTLMASGRCIEGYAQKRCWTPALVNYFLGLLGGLQIITCIWMYLIFKVAYKVVTGKGAEDVRSDEDDTDVESAGEAEGYKEEEDEDYEFEEEDEEEEVDEELFDEEIMDDRDSLSSSSETTLDEKKETINRST